MSEKKSDFVLFAGFRRDTKNDVCRNLIISDKEAVKRWIAEEKSGQASDIETDSSAADPAGTSEAALRDVPSEPWQEIFELMRRFQEAISGYRPLVGVGMLMMPTFRTAFITHEMYKNAAGNLELLERDGEFETYGITLDQFPVVQRQISRLREFDKGAAVLPGAILLSMVSTFDSFFAETMRMMLRQKPERIIASSKTISIKEIMEMNSFDDVINKVIEDELHSLMRGGHDEQIKFVEDNLHIKIRDHYEEWGEFMEIFERRNIVAHGNCIVNLHYIRNCNKHGFSVEADQDGKELSLDAQYLRRSAGHLLEFGLSLMFVLWLKHFKDSSEKAYDSLNHISYELIRDRQVRVAARLLELALFKQTANVPDRVKKMMTINLANSLKKLGNEDRAKEIIQAVDWSASTDNFQICIASLEEDIDRFVELMSRVHKSDLIQKSDYREWPVFDWVRDVDAVREKFEEIYGEPLIKRADNEEQTGEGEPSASASNCGSRSIH